MTGHSGYEESGKDIVCAGISALTQAALWGLEEVVKISLDVKLEETGEVFYQGRSRRTVPSTTMRCSLPPITDEKQQIMARAILETMLIGLRQIENLYHEYVSIDDEEGGGHHVQV